MEITILLLICGLLESVGCFLPYLGSFKPLFISVLSLMHPLSFQDSIDVNDREIWSLFTPWQG